MRWDLYQVSSTASIFTFSVKQCTIWERSCLVHIVFRFAIFVQECWATTVRLEYVTREWNLLQSKIEFACESSSTIIRIESQQLKCHVWPLDAATNFSYALAYTNPIQNFAIRLLIEYWTCQLSHLIVDSSRRRRRRFTGWWWWWWRWAIIRFDNTWNRFMTLSAMLMIMVMIMVDRGYRKWIETICARIPNAFW